MNRNPHEQRKKAKIRIKKFSIGAGSGDRAAPCFFLLVVEEIFCIFAKVVDVDTDVVLARGLRTGVTCEFGDDLYRHATDGKGGDVRSSAGVHGDPLVLWLGLHASVAEERYFLCESELLADALNGAVDYASVNVFRRIHFEVLDKSGVKRLIDGHFRFFADVG